MPTTSVTAKFLGNKLLAQPWLQTLPDLIAQVKSKTIRSDKTSQLSNGLRTPRPPRFSEQLQQVANFIAFLKFQDKRRRVVLDPNQLASLATEFVEEDRALSEEGMSDYAAMLHQEDPL